jgi:hypothetical protein
METRPGFASVTPSLQEAKSSPALIDFLNMGVVLSSDWRLEDKVATDGDVAATLQL